MQLHAQEAPKHEPSVRSNDMFRMQQTGWPKERSGKMKPRNTQQAIPPEKEAEPTTFALRSQAINRFKNIRLAFEGQFME